MELVIALQVKDDKLYDKYREKMLPILEQFGGGFGYDFKIANVLKSEVNKPINRVFTIYFKNEKMMDAFFSNEDYLNIKKIYFENSVSSVVEIARYEHKRLN